MNTRRSPVQLSKKHWAKYTIAGTAALSGVQECEAVIVHVDGSTPGSGLPALIDRQEVSAYAFQFAWNASTNAGRLGSDGGANLRFSHRDFQPPFGSGANAYLFRGTAAGATAGLIGFARPNPPFSPVPFISNLNPGEALNSDRSFLGPGVGILIGIEDTPEFFGSGDAYLGFRFDNATGDGVQFGWARITLNGDTTYVVEEYAYTTAGESISVGQTAIGSPGDFNGDTLVNTADYALWRDSVGQTEEDGVLSDNGDGGVVDGSDYSLWRGRFGTGGSPGGVSQAVAAPEPSALGLLALGAVGVVMTRSRKI